MHPPGAIRSASTSTSTHRSSSMNGPPGRGRTHRAFQRRGAIHCDVTARKVGQLAWQRLVQEPFRRIYLMGDVQVRRGPCIRM
jgi:hypothetical protein